MVMMLRHAARLRLAAARRSPPAWSRTFAAATSSQKRALNRSQLEGKGAGDRPDPPSSGGSSTAAPPASAAASGGGSSSSLLPVAVVSVVVVGGALYYYSTLGQSVNPAETPMVKTPPKVASDTPKKEPALKKEAAPKKEPSAAKIPILKKKELPKKETKEAPTEKAPSAPIGNRVLQIELPPGSRPRSKASTPPPPTHPIKGNRVLMQAPSTLSSEEAAKELDTSIQEEASAAVQDAHVALRANLDESLFADLDSLTESELRVRVVQLASEMKERTKWEAVRLKEFLAMKEKETGDKYMDLMQKQRLDFEAQVSRRLREQEDILSRQAQAALQQKDDNTKEVMEAATAAQKAEHEADLTSAKERLEAEFQTKYETDYEQKLAEEKTKFADELEAKVGIVEGLSSKLNQMEAALKDSKAFEAGSLQAHRLSAAALALAEKLETSSGAAEELRALKVAAKDNAVIEAALAAVPANIATGIPTLPELQTKFEAVHKKCRQAVMVPEGRKGLEGQLLGIAFSTIKYPPNPDEPAPEDAQDDAEYLLARARRHVQLGELERAVEQLDKLQGQAAFTVKDWKQSAKDRVTVAKTLHAIKLESALQNETMSASANEA